MPPSLPFDIAVPFLSKQEPLLLQQLFFFHLLGSFCTILQLSSTEAKKPFCLEKGKVLLFNNPWQGLHSLELDSDEKFHPEEKTLRPLH